MKNLLLKSMMLVLMLFVGMGAWAEDVTSTYTFSSKSWASSVNTGGTACTWSGSKDGNQYNASQTPKGVQVLTGQSGVTITSSVSFTKVKSVAIKYNSSKNAVGTIGVKIGNNTALANQSVAKSQTGTVLTFTPSAAQDGVIVATFNVSTNSYGIESIAVTVDNSGSGSDPDPSTPAVESHNIALSVAAGTYATAQNVKVTNYDNNYIYAYTTDGTEPALDELLDPTGTSVTYSNTNGIDITTACTLKIVAYDEDGNTSNVVSAAYTIKPDAPTYSVDDAPVSVSSKDFKGSATVAISAGAGCDIYYTTDGSTPTTSSNAYTGAFTVTETTTLKAIAVDTYGNVSSYKTLTMTLFKGAFFDFSSSLYGHSGVSANGNTAGDIANGETFVEDNVTITFTQNSSKTQTRFWDNKGTTELRIYDGSSFNVCAPDGYYVTKVAFTGTVNLKVNGTSVSNKTWEGFAEDVTFVNASSNSALQSIKVSITNEASITIGQYGYATFVAPCDLDFSEADVTAYAVTPNLGESKVTLSSVTEVPAGKAIVVKGTEGTHNVPAMASATDFDTALEVSATATVYDEVNTYYYLGVVGEQVGFRPLANGGSIAAGKCFFKVAKSSNAPMLTMSFDDDETGITFVESAAKNGQAFNLAGQRVNTNAKGIIIVNGKKFFNK